MQTEPITHPSTTWSEAARRMRQDKVAQLRLAAMAGHMRIDRVAARRAALIDLLADGRPHTREAIWTQIGAQLGDDCWGKRPEEALWRDIDVLRYGGIRIAYSRRPDATGYYLQYLALVSPPSARFESVSAILIAGIRELTVPEKNERAFAAADFALRQKRLLLTNQHPDWSATAIEEAARQVVFDAPILSEEQPDVSRL
ncbi:MAG: hypothetical protein M9930_07695 [Anaerolineae bacterium]|nr:hypothetical protein [Anaerolineae bacterium]